MNYGKQNRNCASEITGHWSWKMINQKSLSNVKEIFRVTLYKAKFNEKEIMFSKEYHYIRDKMREIPQIRIVKYGNSLEDEIPKFLLNKIVKIIDDCEIPREKI